MTHREIFLDSLKPLQQYLRSNDEQLQDAIQRAFDPNPWFFPDFSKQAIRAIADEFLDEEKCRRWLNYYPAGNGVQQRIAIIMAGNIPLVGFHDLLCVLASGHKAVIKLSEKDSVLPEFLIQKWVELCPALEGACAMVNKLEHFDAVIATGSNNSSRYFEYYFKNYPHLLRKNRNGIAILTGDESPDDLVRLGDDIFMYYGLGCRNVSKIYVPVGYDFAKMEKAFEKWHFLSDHNKYRNNLDYNYAIYIINNVPHINFGHLILKEDEAIASRIGCVHYSYYDNVSDLLRNIELRRNEIQCVVSKNQIPDWEHILPGETQHPKLEQYADGVDTMSFLSGLVTVG